MIHAAAVPAWPALVERASASYRPAGRFALHFARGKLRWDPVFRHLLDARPDRARARACSTSAAARACSPACSRRREDEARRGRWPAGWAPPPSGVRLTGIELSAREVARARDALGERRRASSAATCAASPFRAADTIVILDVLHYVERARAGPGAGAGARRARRSAARCCCASAMPPRAAASPPASGSTAWCSCCAAAGRRPQHGRPVSEWIAHLVGLGFQVSDAADVRGHAVRERAARRHPRPATERRLSPATLDHAGIEALVPHRGTMCLLDRMVDWDAGRIECVAGGHRDPAHPLRSRSGLMASAAIEYAAQAAALHGGLLARASGAAPSPGYLASAREVRLAAWRLDDLPAAASDAAARRRRAPGGRCRPAALRLSGRARRPRDRLRSTRGRARRRRRMRTTEPTLGRRALVTGASGGIGEAIAERLARDGAHVVVHANTRLDSGRGDRRADRRRRRQRRGRWPST